MQSGRKGASEALQQQNGLLLACCSKIQLLCIQFFDLFLDIMCQAGQMYCLWPLFFARWYHCWLEHKMCLTELGGWPTSEWSREMMLHSKMLSSREQEYDPIILRMWIYCMPRDHQIHHNWNHYVSNTRIGLWCLPHLTSWDMHFATENAKNFPCVSLRNGRWWWE